MNRLIRRLRRKHDTLNKAAAAYVGYIYGVIDGKVVGWLRIGESETPAIVDVLIDDQIICAGVVADQHRADVAEAGFGAGNYGFSCPLPASLAQALARRPTDESLIELRAEGESRPVLSRRLVLNLTPPAETVAAPQPVPERETVAPPVPDTVPPERPQQYKARIELIGAEHLRGWAVDVGNPNHILRVEVLIDGVHFCHAQADQPRDDLKRNGLSAGRGGLRVALPMNLLEKGQHRVALRLPDGQLIEQAAHTAPVLPNYPSVDAIMPADVTVIVPVYNAAADVSTCVERLAACTSAAVDILFIDDASTDPAIGDILARAAAHPGMRVLRNATNLGFTRTVNRGINEAGRRHVVLLNSDARVTPGWLEGMLVAAVSRPRVATVTAMSDRAGAFSAPELGNENSLPPGVDEMTFACAFRRRSLAIYPAVPTGNGFCMFVNRACIDAVGALDAEAFPRGYGEENDFCMRAGRAGWLHLVDDRTYVFHDRSKSFGEAKTDLMRAGRAVIDARYPEYKLAIRAFSKGIGMATARMQARRALQDCLDSRVALPRVLFVVATQTGGTPQTNLDLMNAISPDCDPWLMRCDSRCMVLLRWQDERMQEIARHDLHEIVDPIPPPVR